MIDKFVFVATTRLKIDVSNCDGPQKTVIDDGWFTQTITSHCGCTIKSSFTGVLTIRNDNPWCPAFYVFDDKGRFNETICDHKRAHFFKQVNQNDEIKLVLISKTSSQSGNPGNIVEIYAGMFEKYIP